jgi:hypothetical protein
MVMNKICPSCGAENNPTSDYCYQCDTLLEDAPPEIETQTGADSATIVAMENIPFTPPIAESPQPPQIDNVAQPKKTPKKRRKWLWYTLGCAGLLLVTIIGLSLAHLFLLRPFIQREVFQLLKKEVRNSIEIKEYQGRLGNSSIQQKDIEDKMDEIWDQIPGLKKGSIEFQQDNVILSATVYGIKFQIEADVRCDSDGNLLIKTIQTSQSLRLLFVEKDLKKFIEDLVNDEIIDQANIVLKAVQVTEEEIFLTFEAR